MSLIPGYPEGSDITLINTFYQYPKRKENTTKLKKGESPYTDDILTVMFRDNKTGEKKVVDIKKPTYKYYKVKDHILVNPKELFVPREDCDEIEVPYSDLLKSIATETGNLDFFYNNIKAGNRQQNELLHQVNEIFNSDMNIEDQFRYRFLKEYKNDVFPITKSFFDIECDVRNVPRDGTIVAPGTVPVNALTYINQFHEVHVFLLRDDTNPQVAELENEVKSGKIFKEIKEFVENNVGGEKRSRIVFKMDDFKFKFHFYDEKDEIYFIKDFFACVHMDRPDFIFAWNAGFDIPYLIERCRVLGYNPQEICCPDDVDQKIAYYRIDEKHKNVVAEKGDRYYINGRTIWDDQMRHFGSRRKGQSAFERYSLDYIGGKVAGVNKYDYTSLGATIYDLAQVNYKMFVFYNVCDVVVQYCIENKVDDAGYVFGKCLINGTQYHKCHRQSVYLTNKATYEFWKDGFIISNNRNRGNEKPKEKFPGAMVGDMNNVTNYARIMLCNSFVNIADNVNDFDYKSLYPSTAIQHNMAPNTQIGRIIINQVVHEDENRFNYGKYSRGGTFIEDYESDNFIEFAHRWLHLGSYKDLIHDIQEYYSNIQTPYGYIDERNDCVWYTGREYQPEEIVRLSPYPVRDWTVRLKREDIDYTPYIDKARENAQMTINSFEHIVRRIENERYEDIEFQKFLDQFDENSLMNTVGVSDDEYEED